MLRGKLLSTLFLLLAALPGMAHAANTVLAGTFTSTADKTAPLPGTCGGSDPLAYQVAGSMQVTVTGTYFVFDALYLRGIKHNGLDISGLLYRGAFNVNNPTANLVTPDGIDGIESVTLQAGVTYVLVVQQWCENREGTWALTFTGPGSVNSESAVDLHAMMEGRFGSTDPVVETACGVSQYHQSGPVQVSTTGTYYYADISFWTNDIDLCLQVFTAPFDPSNPTANRVGTSDPGGAFLDDVGTVELEAGRDYWFVVQPLDIEAYGDYFFLLAPPAPFRINKALAGAWYFPPTNGQGFFMEVYDDQNLLFLAWFTYELQRPVDGTAVLGEPGHRWLTAMGPIDGNSAQMDVYLARGGVFDAPDPPIETPQTNVGSMTVEFDDCISGTVQYAFTTPPVSGQLPIEPVAGLRDHVELCHALSRGPGIPGAL